MYMIVNYLPNFTIHTHYIVTLSLKLKPYCQRLRLPTYWLNQINSSSITLKSILSFCFKVSYNRFQTMCISDMIWTQQANYKIKVPVSINAFLILFSMSADKVRNGFFFNIIKFNYSILHNYTTKPSSLTFIFWQIVSPA